MYKCPSMSIKNILQVFLYFLAFIQLNNLFLFNIITSCAINNHKFFLEDNFKCIFHSDRVGNRSSTTRIILEWDLKYCQCAARY